MASSSSKVAALANMFQPQDQANLDSSHGPNPKSGEKSGRKVGGSGSASETPRPEEKVESGVKHYKNNLNLRRTSSHVARFSSAKKVFEMKDKESVASGRSERSRSPLVSPNLANTLPQRLCSPGLRAGSKIPIGEFWNDKKDKRLGLEKISRKKDNSDDLMNKIITEKSAEILESVSMKTFPEPGKSRQLKKYEALMAGQSMDSPALNMAESQFTGLLETILSPEYRQAEQDFQRIADANISSDNLLDETTEKSVDCHHDHGLLDVDTQFLEENSKDERLQSTFKEFVLTEKNVEDEDPSQNQLEYKASLDFEGRESGEAVKEQDKTSDLSAPGANASSLGSSLEGQTVSSWLATTVNTTDDALISDTTTSDTDLSKKMDTEPEEQAESSDYVSAGDSCDFVTPKSVGGGGGDGSEPPEGVDVKVHFLEDGHFWYEGSPLEAVLEEKTLNRKVSMVSFSTSPIKHFSTFSKEDYDRRNEDIDPEIASAEYELEKRLEKMDFFKVNISKEEDSGLGVGVIGVGAGVASEASLDKLGIFVKAVIPGGPIDLDGRIQVGDQLVSVDGKSLVGVNQFQAAEILNMTGQKVEITVGRDPEPGEDQVFQIIQQTNSTTEEEIQESQEESPRKSSNELMLTDDGKKLFCFDLEKVNVTIAAVQPEQKSEEDNTPVILEGVKKLSENISICDVNDLLEDEDEEDADLDKVSDGEESPCNETKEAEDAEDDIRAKNLLKTSVIVQNQENIPTSTKLSAACCPYKNKYESLLERLERSDDLARQLSSNLKAVKSQLLSREQTIQLYVENVDQLINQDCMAEPSQDMLKTLLELREKLSRPPHIPPEVKVELPPSDLDTVLCSSQVLSSEAAKDKIRLNRRSLVHRRSSSRFPQISGKKMSLSMPLDNIFRRNRMRCSLPIIPKGRSNSCSNSISDSDAVSSASSVQSVPETSEQTQKKKKPKSLIRNLKRRMSLSSYNKDQSQ